MLSRYNHKLHTASNIIGRSSWPPGGALALTLTLKVLLTLTPTITLLCPRTNHVLHAADADVVTDADHATGADTDHRPAAVQT